MKVTVSAPGKLMLFGEHAVIHQHPCLVTAVDLRIQVTMEKTDVPMIFITTPTLKDNRLSFTLPLNELYNDQYLHPQTQFVIASIRKVFTKYNLNQGLSIHTSGPTNSFGLGSSSAVTVACIFALASLFEIQLNNQQIFDLAFAAVLEVQGAGSGFDVASATYGGTLFYQPKHKVEILPVEHLPIVIAYSGSKVSTTNLLQKVDRLRNQFPEIIDPIFNTIGRLSSLSRMAILQKDWQTVGKLANINQGLLESLGVSTSQLQKPILAAREAGALGAKLSGAGGGDCMFAIVSDEIKPAVEAAIENSGAQILQLDTNTDGVRLEIAHV